MCGVKLPVIDFKRIQNYALLDIGYTFLDVLCIVDSKLLLLFDKHTQEVTGFGEFDETLLDSLELKLTSRLEDSGLQRFHEFQNYVFALSGVQVFEGCVTVSTIDHGGLNLFVLLARYDMPC
jgi:hypothetical protein